MMNSSRPLDVYWTDTLRPERFQALTRSDLHGRVLAGIDAARAEGFPLKLDTVLVRGTNDDEVLDLLAFARGIGAEIRFIEYMDVGGATRWTREQVVSRAELLALLRGAHGTVEPSGAQGSDPAERFRLADGTVFGIIASTTTPFCRTCDRSRLTADGTWYTCLYARSGANLRGALRGAAQPTRRLPRSCAWAGAPGPTGVRRNASRWSSVVPWQRRPSYDRTRGSRCTPAEARARCALRRRRRRTPTRPSRCSSRLREGRRPADTAPRTPSAW